MPPLPQGDYGSTNHSDNRSEIVSKNKILMLPVQQRIHEIERGKTKKGIRDNAFDVEQKEADESKQKCK